MRVPIVSLIILSLAAAACSRPAPPATTPRQEVAPMYTDPQAAVAARVADLLSRMTLDEKIGQMSQVDYIHLRSPADVTTYAIGSILASGDAAPSPNRPETWAAVADRYQDAALKSRLGIPLIFGVDALHGNNQVGGATVFPHNIGLGATRNPALVEQIGRATALEMAGTGWRWAFAPCLAVGRDERWGRTYETYGEEPELVASMTSIVSGLQGKTLHDPTSVLASVKHFLGDGHTSGGKDQGDTQVTEAELRAIDLPPYRAAVARGAGTVMASYSSVNGVKMHGHKALLTDLLKGELGFRGFVVSDYHGISQIHPDYPTAVRNAINAGVDMAMVAEEYLQFIAALKAEVQAGRVALERIDDAVRRILTIKFEMGLFEHPRADRKYLAKVGAPEHRALAREAVRQSVVLLKNENRTLPLAKQIGKLYVAGKNADDTGNQSGGWTLTWQGKSGNENPGTTILQAIRQTVAPGTVLTYDRSAERIDSSYKAAIVVLGELPYAEMKGDRPDNLRLDAEDLATLARVKASGVPTVVVLVSGRPLVVTEQLPDWQAFLAAWLPGSEGQGVADVLFGDYKPTGKLPLSWPRSEQQIPINVGDKEYDPLFPFGFGLSY